MKFRRDVVQVTRKREPGVTLEKIAADFGVHRITLSTWLKQADIDESTRPEATRAESDQFREANKRSRLSGQEAEVLKRALAYVSQGSLLGKSTTRS